QSSPTPRHLHSFPTRRSSDLVSNAAIPVIVKEEFTSADNPGLMTWNINGRNTVIKGPRRYLSVTLEPADDFGVGPQVSLRDPRRSEEHTSELQSRENLVCRLL